MSIAEDNIDYNGCNLNDTDIADHSSRYVPVCLDSVFYVSDTLLLKFGK